MVGATGQLPPKKGAPRKRGQTLFPILGSAGLSRVPPRIDQRHPQRRRSRWRMLSIRLRVTTWGAVVATLLVRKLEPELVERLKRQAASHGRSVAAEHRAILRAALQPKLDGKELFEMRARAPSRGHRRQARWPRAGTVACGMFRLIPLRSPITLAG